jgi:hypothetical protein
MKSRFLLAALFAATVSLYAPTAGADDSPTTELVPAAVVVPAGSYEGVPLSDAPQEVVTLTGPDGYQVQTGVAEATQIKRAVAAPTTTTTTTSPTTTTTISLADETHEQYEARLLRQWCEDEPWNCPIGQGPEDPNG